MKKSVRKALLIGAAFVLVAALSVGLTLAFLQSATPVYTNTFTFANGITITLNEGAAGNYKIVPGKTQEKVVTATVTNDIDCWVYIGVKGENTTGIVNWAIAGGWTALGTVGSGLGAYTYGEGSNAVNWDGYTVYYRSVNASENAQTFGVLANDQISYPNTLTAADIDPEKEITLKFTARAIQQEGFGSAVNAWNGELLPQASVNEITGEDLTVQGAVLTDLSNPQQVVLNAGATFTAPEEDSNAYDDWICDFVLSFDKDIVDLSKVYLFGQYDLVDPNTWFGGPMGESGDSLTAGTAVRILQAIGMERTYEEIRTEVGTFNCGLYLADNTAFTGESITATLQLVLYNPDIPGEFVVVSVLPMTIAQP